MKVVECSHCWFDRIPSALAEWGGFFIAIRYELESLVSAGHIGSASVYIPEREPEEDTHSSEFDEAFRLYFYFHDDSIVISFSDNKVSFDDFTVNSDSTWSYDPEDLETVGELTPEFAFWLDDQESLAGKAAVLAIAVARAWIITPPSYDAGLAFEITKPWAD